MLADNSSHLRATVCSKHEAARRRAVVALDKLQADGAEISITALAKAAGVARSWIYTQPDLIEQIRQAT
jgi:predicted regulator of amino acid metabolism with ACT domain